MVDVLHHFGGQGDRLETGATYQPRETVSKAVDGFYSVAVRQRQHHRADHVVEPRAESAAGHDTTNQAFGVEKDAVARSGMFERRGCSTGLEVGCELIGGGAEQNPDCVIDKAFLPAEQRAGELGFTQGRYRERLGAGQIDLQTLARHIGL